MWLVGIFAVIVVNLKVGKSVFIQVLIKVPVIRAIQPRLAVVAQRITSPDPVMAKRMALRMVAAISTCKV